MVKFNIPIKPPTGRSMKRSEFYGLQKRLNIPNIVQILLFNRERMECYSPTAVAARVKYFNGGYFSLSLLQI